MLVKPFGFSFWDDCPNREVLQDVLHLLCSLF